MKNNVAVLSIVGPTASGKTSLSIKIASDCNGEIISADSRQVYRGVDLLSGKVTPEEASHIPHHLIDIADPNTTYTASDFLYDATNAITRINDQNRTPIVAGGTFFYTDILFGKIAITEVPPNPQFRHSLDNITTPDLFKLLSEKDSITAQTIDKQNRRRLIRALEIVNALGHVPRVRPNTNYNVLTIGILIQSDVLRDNIQRRLLERIKSGMIEEAAVLIESGVSHDRMESLGLECRYVSRYLRGIISKEELEQQLFIKIVQFAKRQMTWLKRDTTIRWYTLDDIQSYSTIYNEVALFLDKDR
jgi:tRNA dimethylallyltransferase